MRNLTLASSTVLSRLRSSSARRDLLNATAIARLLFSDDEPGVFYDFDDWSTLFQDTAGTQPVTAANQGVALALDKRLGLELGPELVTNGTFDTDTDWVKNPGVTISGGEAVLSGPTGNPVLSQNGVFSAGKFYRVTFTVSGHVSGTASIRCYGTGGNEVIASASANGVVSVVYFSRADATGLIGFAGTSLTMNIDNISVRELKGNHATQATTAARPLTVIHPDGGVRNLLDRSEEFDNAVWIWGAQLELGSTATPYQKRVNFLDVTEAGKRSIRRLYFNGTSHFMTTLRLRQTPIRLRCSLG
jgi:hypothetical protein